MSEWTHIWQRWTHIWQRWTLVFIQQVKLNLGRQPEHIELQQIFPSRISLAGGLLTGHVAFLVSSPLAFNHVSNQVTFIYEPGI